MNDEHKRQILLVNECKKGNRKAKELLIKSVYGFVYRFAKMKAGPHTQVIDDLVQVGFIAILEKAIPKFDPSMRYTFLNYASYWIVHDMNVYLNANTSLPFRLPDNIGHDFRLGMISGKFKFPESFNMSLVSSIQESKSKDGKVSSIFDSISYPEKEDIAYIEEIVLSTLDRLKVNNVHRDRFERYYCIGKYKDFPMQSMLNLKTEFGVSRESIRSSVERVLKILKSELTFSDI